ncbi:MAG: hypothetical protein EOP84_03670 [Verrucomicrobiaceae bacterium]|nr:MAG: hypothetical protein EOP84_03670 [Verrucomicrobiaceae bacterium]
MPTLTAIAFLFWAYAALLWSLPTTLIAGPFGPLQLPLAVAAGTGLLMRRKWGRMCAVILLWVVLGTLILGFLFFVAHFLSQGFKVSNFSEPSWYGVSKVISFWLAVGTPTILLLRFLNRPLTRMCFR